MPISYSGPANVNVTVGANDGNNGLSISTIDPNTLVLGQDVGQTGDPAILLSNREIPMGGFFLNLLGSNGNFTLEPDSSFVQGGAASGNDYLMWMGQPNNYGTVYPGFGEANLFSTGWGIFAVNPSGRPNVVGIPWSYNSTTGAGRRNANEAAFTFRTETHFEDIGSGVPYQFEFHLPEFTDQSGVRRRLWSAYVDKTGVTVPAWISLGAGITFNSWNDPTETWGFINADGGQMRLLNNVAGTTNFPSIRLGSLKTPVNGIAYPGPNWDLQITNEVSEIIFGRPSLALADGAITRFVDRVTIGDTSAAASRVLTVNGYTILQNYIAGLRPLDVIQNDAGSAQVANFINGVAAAEILQVNKTDVRVWDSIRLRVGSSAAPTAQIDIAAGTAAAGTAPLKFNAGVNLTVPEAGAMEFDGTDLFFTKVATREPVLMGTDAAAAPATTAGAAIVNFYGTSDANFLGDPVSWASVKIGAVTYKIPLYT